MSANIPTPDLGTMIQTFPTFSQTVVPSQASPDTPPLPTQRPTASDRYRSRLKERRKLAKNPESRYQPVFELYPQMLFEDTKYTCSRGKNREKLEQYGSCYDNTRAYYELMKSIYPDRTLLRDILLKHKKSLREVIKHYHYEIAVGRDPTINSSTIDNLSILLSDPYRMTDEEITIIIYGLNGIYEDEFTDMSFFEPDQFRESNDQEEEREYISRKFKKFWQKFLSDLQEAGYEFHYFDFFRSDHPMVRVFWDRPWTRLLPTPEIFESLSLFLVPGQYEAMSNAISNNWSMDTMMSGISKWIGNYPKLVGWRKEDLAQAIKATGLNNQIIVPDQRSKQYAEDLEKYQKLKSEYEQTGDVFIRNKIDQLKYELSGYPGNISVEGRYSSEIKEMFGRTSGAGPSSLGFDSTGLFARRQGLRGVMIGFDQSRYGGVNAYMPKYYYETIYRRIFNTLINVDWAQVCQQGLIDLPKLRMIAISDFSFPEDQVNQLDQIQICGLLEQESARRRGIREQLTIGIPEAQEAVKYQPGGAMMRQLQTEVAGLGLGAAPTVEPKPISPQLQRLIEMCEDPNTTREQIFALAQEMDLEVLLSRASIFSTGRLMSSDVVSPRLLNENQTKEDYCRILRNYLEQL
jgi:hypothetical protein